MNFQSLKDIDVKGKIVLLRADLNVPAENGVISDTTRIDRLKPTLDYLTKNGAKTLVLSHFGRPKGLHQSSRSNSCCPLWRKAGA